MIRDLYLRILFIPLLGVLLPWTSGIVHYERYHLPFILLIIFYFTVSSFIIWTGCYWIHTKIRTSPTYNPGPARRVIIATFMCTLYGICIGSIAGFGWIQFAREPVTQFQLLRFILYCAIAVVLFNLVYEILFLVKEKEQDTKKVNQLGKERSAAKLHALQNELDPHFLFNSLNTLNHLILKNPEQAHLFNNKLAQVYKYFLINKDKELIPLEKELGFIDDYFYLLQLRYDQKLKLEVHLQQTSPSEVKIPPCSLQILLENAIKHNSFSDEEPLQIIISLNGQYIKVMNRMRPKPYMIDSTRIGLNNLNARYKLLFDKEIIIHPGKENFTVKLPVIR